MKLHLISDVHLNFGDLVLPGGADILIIAGDTIECDKTSLKKAKRFFEEELTKYPRVLVVMGNHEFYGCDLEEAKEHMSEALPNNAILLDDHVYEQEGWTFFGGTLWTDMNKGNPITSFYIRDYMNDFRRIKKSKQPYYAFKPQVAATEHARTLRFLDSAIHNKDKVFVITHHAPSYRSIDPKFANMHEANHAYASDLSEFILDLPQIKYWIHGHVHCTNDYKLGNTRVLSHPRGYAGYELPHGDVYYKPLELEI